MVISPFEAHPSASDSETTGGPRLGRSAIPTDLRSGNLAFMAELVERGLRYSEPSGHLAGGECLRLADVFRSALLGHVGPGW